MAKAAGSAVKIYLDQYDFSGVLNASSQAVEQDTPVVTAFSDAGPRRVVGNHDVMHEDSGLFEPVDDGYDEQIHAMLEQNTDRYLGKFWQGIGTEGNIAYESIIRMAGRPIVAGREAAILAHFRGAGAGQLSRGVVLRSGTITGNGNGTGQNLGATSANTVFQAIIRVVSVSAFTTATIAIQESQNDGGADPYATIAGMSQVVTAASVWRLTTTAATEAWKRVNIASWTGTSIVLLVTAGTVAGT